MWLLNSHEVNLFITASGECLGRPAIQNRG